MIDLHIYCDFDGTISTTDVTDSLLAAFAGPGWEDIEAEWRIGRITARECMAAQVELLDMDEDEFRRHLDGIEIDPAFPRFAADCRKLGVSLTILSDGLAPAIRHVLHRHGLDHLPTRANGLVPVGARKWRFIPADRRSCCGQGMCKCAVIERVFDADAPFSILIGDGRSDFCGARAADMVFAKDDLGRYCHDQGIPHLTMSDFDDARPLLRSLLGSADNLGDAAATVALELSSWVG